MRFKRIIFYSLLIINYSLSAQPLSHIYPHNNAIVSDTVINFQWNTNPGAVSYDLQVAADILFTSDVQNFTGLVSPNSQLPVLHSGNIYYWHVRAYDGSAYTSWTNDYKLTTFNPKILSGLKLWLAADAGVVLSGSNVTQWNDLSENGNNATQSTSNKQPIFVNSVLNNKPIIRFDGTDDELATNAIVFSATNKVTAFIVFKQTAGGHWYECVFGCPEGATSTTGFGLIAYYNKCFAALRGDVGLCRYVANDT
ncbi:MAG: hypothetical protein WC223_05290, partial [Bacteroidales bacterium]